MDVDVEEEGEGERAGFRRGAEEGEGGVSLDDGVGEEGGGVLLGGGWCKGRQLPYCVVYAGFTELEMGMRKCI